jgi:hypothetical protein
MLCIYNIVYSPRRGYGAGILNGVGLLFVEGEMRDEEQIATSFNVSLALPCGLFKLAAI